MMLLLTYADSYFLMQKVFETSVCKFYGRHTIPRQKFCVLGGLKKLNNATPRQLYPREREPIPILQEAGWAPEPVWRGTENFPIPGFDLQTV